MCWLCLLVVHSLIEMGVWVLSDCKSACQLAFSALFPISIKHPHHLLWAHSSPLCFSPQPCSADRWCVPSTNHFSSHIEGCLTPCSWAHFHFGRLEWVLVDWMVEWELQCTGIELRLFSKYRIPSCSFWILALFLCWHLLLFSIVNTWCGPIKGKHPYRCHCCQSSDKGLLYEGALYFAF